MGRDIEQTLFSEDDYKKFGLKLHSNLEALRRAVRCPGFGAGPDMLGAELELYLLDESGNPSYSNKAVQQALNDKQLTLELNQFNVEYNLSAIELKGNSLSFLEQEIANKLHNINQLEGVTAIPIGILPSLTQAQCSAQAMTDLARYHALQEIIKAWHAEDFKINFSGEEHLDIHHEWITLEGACTSFQVHYKMAHKRFVRLWNAAQLVAPLVLAVSANSPIALGKKVWHESRIPLFKQSIDGRRARGKYWREPPRVGFGHGWLRNNPCELFAQNVNVYPAMIPICGDEDALAVVDAGGLPALEELCLHNGTVWSWNRAIYSAQGEGHIRIEFRSLPAGPTAIDMAANAALMIGLMEAVEDNIESLINALPFNFAEYNFYRAAQYGMNANLVWPIVNQNGLSERPVSDIVSSLLPFACDGLRKAGINEQDISRYMGVIEQRIASRCNGAVWQLQKLNQLEETMGREQALREMVSQYAELALSNQPVGSWPCR